MGARVWDEGADGATPSRTLNWSVWFKKPSFPVNSFENSSASSTMTRQNVEWMYAPHSALTPLWNARSSSSCRFTLPENHKSPLYGKRTGDVSADVSASQQNAAGTRRVKKWSDAGWIALVDLVDGLEGHGALERLDAEAEDAHD